MGAPLVPVVGVGGIVLRTGPEVLVVERGRPPSVGVWTFPGGKLEGGETIAQAVERELFEETGLRVVAGELVQVVEIVREGYHYVIHDHLCTMVDPDQKPRPGDDVRAVRFARPSELAQLGTSEETMRVLVRALAMRQACLEDE